MSDTNAVKWLRAQGAAFDVLEYEFSELVWLLGARPADLCRA